MKRTLAAVLSLAVAAVTTATLGAGAAGCASHKSTGSPARPASTAASTCGRKPLLCVDGFEQCTMGPDGCETCTCTKAGGFNSLDPRMPP